MLEFEFALLILSIRKIELVVLVFIQITLLLTSFIYCFIIDNKNMQIINKT